MNSRNISIVFDEMNCAVISSHYDVIPIVIVDDKPKSTFVEQDSRRRIASVKDWRSSKELDRSRRSIGIIGGIPLLILASAVENGL